MYLFRAINEEYDKKAYIKKEDLKAKEKRALGYMKDLAKHVASGSKNSYQGCWISTTKDFYVCASEYAIPQMGKYNTTKKEKDIIVIDAMNWRGHTLEYESNGNYTIFTNGKRILIDIGNKLISIGIEPICGIIDTFFVNGSGCRVHNNRV